MMNTGKTKSEFKSEKSLQSEAKSRIPLGTADELKDDGRGFPAGTKLGFKEATEGLGIALEDNKGFM